MLYAYQRVSQPPLYNASFSLKVAKYAVFSGANWPIPIFYPVSRAVILYTNDHSSLFNISESVQCYRERETALDKYGLFLSSVRSVALLYYTPMIVLHYSISQKAYNVTEKEKLH